MTKPIRTTDKLPGLCLELKDHSLFKTHYRLSDIVPEGMSYGTYENNTLVEGKETENRITVFNKTLLGRGIHIARKGHDVTVRLSLPASFEEIDAFFEVVIRGANKRLYEVLLNGKPLLPKNLDHCIQNAKNSNLKILHKLMAEVLNDDCVILFRVLKRTLASGEKEAETMWAGIDTDVYRDWMNTLQKEDCFIAEPHFIQENAMIQGIYTFPAGKPVLMPDYPRTMILKNTGQPINDWFVELMQEDSSILGRVPFESFKNALDQRMVHYYDALSSKIDSLDDTRLRGIFADCSSNEVAC